MTLTGQMHWSLKFPLELIQELASMMVFLLFHLMFLLEEVKHNALVLSKLVILEMTKVTPQLGLMKKLSLLIITDITTIM